LYLWIGIGHITRPNGLRIRFAFFGLFSNGVVGFELVFLVNLFDVYAKKLLGFYREAAVIFGLIFLLFFWGRWHFLLFNN